MQANNLHQDTTFYPAFVFDPYGLVDGQNNRFGEVVSNEVRLLKSIYPSSPSLDFLQNTVSKRPSFVPNFFGTGLHAARSIVAGDNMFRNDVVGNFKPQATDEFYIAFKFNLSTNSGFPLLYSITNQSYSILAGFQVIVSSGLFVFALRNSDQTLQQSTRTSLQYGDGTNYDMIFHNAGTNDANDNKIYVSGVEVAKTVGSNDDLSAVDLYPSSGTWVHGLFGRTTDVNTAFQGYMGRMAMGYGPPNLFAIDKFLNNE